MSNKIDLDRYMASLHVAFEEGAKAGKDDSQIGNKFRSAWGAARELGYFDDKRIRNVFTTGYLSEIGKQVVTDQDGIVIR
jgi:hypothetical protein